jgi:hypothetical protein
MSSCRLPATRFGDSGRNQITIPDFIGFIFQVTTQVRFYETLDDLLVSTSPAYAAKRVETLMARLEELSEAS